MAFEVSSPVMAQGYYYRGGYDRPNPPGYTCTSLGCCPTGWSVQGGECKPYQGAVGGPRYRPYGYYRPNPPGYTCTSLGCCPKGMSVQDGVCKPYRGY
jgi:hypothetical protein